MKSFEKCEKIRSEEGNQESFFSTYETYADVPEDVKFKN